MEHGRRLAAGRAAVTLRSRMFMLISGLVVASVGLVTWTVAERARAAFEASDGLRVAAQVAQVRREVERQGDDIVRRIERIADSDTFQRTALEIGRRADHGAYVNDAAALASAQNLDLLDLVMDDGTLISSAEWPARFGYKHPWANAAALGRPQPFIEPVELPHERTLGLVVVRRVAVGPRAIYLAGGRRLDQTFLKSLTLPVGMRVWLYRDIEPEVARQQLIGAGADAGGRRFEPIISRVRQSGKEAIETLDGPDGSEAVDAIPLNGSNGTSLAVLLLVSSGSELSALVARIRWSGVAVGVVGIALGFAASYVVASRVTRPVEQLAIVANEIASGNWDARPPVLDATGEVRSLAVAFDTMTRQLADQRDRLVQVERVAAWRELARRLAHELKNPLFPLRLTIDNLRRAKQLSAPDFDEVLAESLATLDTGLASLNAVVGRFSDFSKMPAPDIKPINPNAIVEGAVTLFRAQLDAPGRPTIAVELDLDPQSASIAADGEQLGRAVQNLLLNAIDAMPGGGTLAIRTRRDGAVFHITVSDTGTGLTAEECARLFTPYYTTKQHGTGLGLAIVQSVVADHRGRVWVDSMPGRGATFHIELPA